MLIRTATCTHTDTHMHGRRKKSAWPLLKVGHMGSAKICRNGNESTFRQTSMHHAGASNNQKQQHANIHAHHTSFMYKHRLVIVQTARARQALNLQQTSIHTAGHTKHAYACPSNYTHLVDSLPRRDCDRWECVWCWRENSGEKEMYWERRRVYTEAPQGLTNYLSNKVG